MSHQLKIKYTSLAAEATLIHKEELRCKRFSRRNGRKLGKLRWTAERRERRMETSHKDYTGQAIWTDDNLSDFHSLRNHRYELKEELRATALARAFLSGYSYRQIERTTNPLKGGPKVHRITRLVAKYGDPVELGIDQCKDRDEAEALVRANFVEPWLKEPEQPAIVVDKAA